jgi:hypothetical protein
MKSDPLCDLYGKRYKKIRKPFLSMKRNTEYFDSPTYEDDAVQDLYNDPKYMGYKDDDFGKLLNSTKNLTHFLSIDDDDVSDGNCISLSKPKRSNNHKNKSSIRSKPKQPKKTPIVIAPEDDDDIYLQNAAETNYEDDDDSIAQLNSTHPPFEEVYSNTYEESDDEVDMCTNNNVKHTEEDEEDSQRIDNELQRNLHINSVRSCSEFSKERQYIDLIIYVLSGIILIFMMEQFIQIGMRIKAPIF